MFQNNLLMAAASAGGGQFTVTAEELQPFFTFTGTVSKTFSDVDLGDDTSDAKHVAQTTATTGDIVFTQASGGFGGAVFQTFQMLNGSATPTDTISNNAMPSTGTIDIVAGGFCIGIMESNTSATLSWIGLTERYDRGSNAAYGIAYDMEMSAETGRTVTATPSGAPGQRALAVASFGPA